MTVGFYSPLPPARTGIADYSAALAHVLETRCTLRMNRDGDVNLYHIGNNQLHASIYRRALDHPGVVVLHDAVLQHFALGYLSQNEYVREFVYNYGEWTRGLADQLWRERRRSAIDPTYFRYPMLKRLVERSRLVIVHNPAAARIVREHVATANVIEIPHLLIPHAQAHIADSERVRLRFGAGPVFGIFGHLRESKRLLSILRVFSRRPACRLLLAGEIASPDLRRACAPYLGAANVHRIGYMTSAEYWVVAGAVDVCLNLRYPAAGETSGVSIGMMGVGTTVIMTDSEENARYPGGACIKISPGVSEEAELEAIVEWVQTHRSYVREIGAAGAAYVRLRHAADVVADAFTRAMVVN